jgi:predicted Zn-dependent peptidase
MLRRLTLAVPAVALALAACAKPEPAPVAPEPAPAPEPEPAGPPPREYPEPPAPTAAKQVNFPDYGELVIANGLKVYVVENHEVPVVSSVLVVRAGTMDDEFLAGFTAEMVREGTKKRTKAQFDEAIEGVGGSIGSGASIHTSQMSSTVLKKDVALALELMADATINPRLPPESLDKVKDAAVQGLKSSKAQAAVLAQTLFGMVAYPKDHPYGRPFPTEERIKAVSLDDLKAFHDKFYRSNNAFLILSGDITPEEAKPLVEKAFGKWKSIDPAQIPPNPLNKFTNYTLPDKLVVHLVDRPASAQAEIVVGNLALARNHPDWEKAYLANQVLGADATGRLFMDIREEKGLTYGIYSSVSTGQAPGTFEIGTSTKTKSAGEMLTAIFDHLRRIREEPMPAEDVARVQAKITGSFPLQLETADQIAGKVSETLIYGLPADYYKVYRDKIAAVTPEDAATAAKKYMHAIPHVVVVGKAKKIEEQIKQALPEATIVKYDTDLNIVK